MATITSLGIGSGLDLNGMLTKLMQVEQQPLINMQKQEATYQARISALGSLKGNLSALQSAAATLTPSVGQTATAKFAILQASSSDSTVATATVSSGAATASYSLTNITLATAQQIRKSGTSLAMPASGQDGTLSIAVGGATAVPVSVKGGSSLSDIASAINGAGAGVNAAVINDGTTDHLVLSANNSGASNTISITGSANWTGFDYSTGSANSWTQQQAAGSASVDVNGLTVKSDSNTISSAIKGVTITLNKNSSAGTTLSVTQDSTTNITSALNTFIKAYNSAASAMSDLGAYDPTTKKAGALQGDSALQSAQNQVRRMISTTAGGSSKYQTLSDIGVAVQKDGTLKLDTVKLNAAIGSDFAGVAAVVAKIGSTFNDGLTGIVGASGTLTAATDNTTNTIKQLQAREAEMSRRLDNIQAQYTKQFTALDTTVSQLNSTSSWLTQQLSALSGNSSSK